MIFGLNIKSGLPLGRVIFAMERMKIVHVSFTDRQR